MPKVLASNPRRAKVERNTKKGTAKLTVTVPGPGEQATQRVAHGHFAAHGIRLYAFNGVAAKKDFRATLRGKARQSRLGRLSG